MTTNFAQLQYTLRRAYYSSLSPSSSFPDSSSSSDSNSNHDGGGSSGGSEEDFDFGLNRARHTAHCFEYLRQSIMCGADSTVEPAENAEEGAFLGWGFRRQCWDYLELKRWAERWRAFDATGFLARPVHQAGS